ncbi:hypothetical protein CITRIK5_110023 [Citricoccus sp. K5]|nr:hypothetical protein CITRIK5_110023 [Citricoccus sp. K5]
MVGVTEIRFGCVAVPALSALKEFSGKHLASVSVP